MARRARRVIRATAVVMVALGAAPPLAVAVDCPDVPLIGVQPPPCTLIEKGTKLVNGGAQTVRKVKEKGPGGAAQDLVGGIAESATEPVFGAATKWVSGAAAWLVTRIGRAIDTTTAPRLDSRWFREQYRVMLLLGAWLSLPFLLLALAQAALRRDPGLLVRAFTQLPTAFLLSAVAAALATLLLELTDWACSAVAASVGQSTEAFFRDVGKALQFSAGSPVPLFLAFVVGILTVLAALAVWIELLIRSAGIYVCVLFVPFALAATVWPPLKDWARRLAEALTAIILSKFVIVAIMSLAAAGLTGSRASEGFNGALAGAALLMLAAFAPLVLFRLVAFAESTLSSRGGSSGSVPRGAQTALGAAQSMQLMMARTGGPSARLAPAGASASGATGGIATGPGGGTAAGGTGGAGAARAGGAGVASAGGGPLTVAAAGMKTAAGTVSRSTEHATESLGAAGGGSTAGADSPRGPQTASDEGHAPRDPAPPAEPPGDGRGLGRDRKDG